MCSELNWIRTGRCHELMRRHFGSTWSEALFDHPLQKGLMHNGVVLYAPSFYFADSSPVPYLEGQYFWGHAIVRAVCCILKRNAHRANSLWIVIQYWSTINIIRALGVFEGLSTKHTQAHDDSHIHVAAKSGAGFWSVPEHTHIMLAAHTTSPTDRNRACVRISITDYQADKIPD